MKRRSGTKIVSLVIRLLFLLILVICGILLYRKCTKPTEKFTLENSPLQVERIRDILELNTIRFRDEVVVDSLEYYTGAAEAIEGNLQKLVDPDQLKNAFSTKGIKRRLTLIVRGELLYGVNLKSSKFRITEDSTGLHIHVPEPKLLNISVTPNQTEIYSENGVWTDAERRFLEKKALQKMERSAIDLGLPQRSKVQAETMIRKLMRSPQPVSVEFE